MASIESVPHDLLRHLFETFLPELYTLISLQFVNKRWRKSVERAVERERQRTFAPGLQSRWPIGTLSLFCERGARDAILQKGSVWSHWARVFRGVSSLFSVLFGHTWTFFVVFSLSIQLCCVRWLQKVIKHCWDGSALRFGFRFSFAALSSWWNLLGRVKQKRSVIFFFIQTKDLLSVSLPLQRLIAMFDSEKYPPFSPALTNCEFFWGRTVIRFSLSFSIDPFSRFSHLSFSIVTHSRCPAFLPSLSVPSVSLILAFVYFWVSPSLISFSLLLQF